MALTGSASMTNELQGSVEGGGELHGKMSGLEMIRGYSAFEVAVINGFSGTVDEWLASLKGEDGDDGRGIADIEVIENAFIVTYTDNTVERVPFHVKASVARISEVTLLAANWTGEDNPYAQRVNIEGVTERSQVNLTPSVEQLAIFYDKSLAFVTENEDGAVTVYAIGQKPENDYTIQVTIAEVSA